MPFWRHLDAPQHRLPVPYFTCEHEAWSGGIIWIHLGADETEVHGEHAKRLVECWVLEHFYVERAPLIDL